MKKTLFTMLILVAAVCINTAVFAAELLDVKPVVSGTAVSVEIAADIAMTYTYYKVPGQARAVVDIAEADPEKVEPLIVVNKGALASISVDKAEISGLVVSRLIFNLKSETEIQVSAAPDRKKLTVTFGGDSSATGQPAARPDETKPVPAAISETIAEPAVVPTAPSAPLTAAPEAATAPDDDPLGLDEPAAKTAVTPVPAAAAVAAVTATQPIVMRIPKLEPVVPATAAAMTTTAGFSIKEITTGAASIEIKTNQAVNDYKTIKLTAPDRLAIDIPCESVNQKPKSIAVNKFGISKVRIGVAPKNIRVVLDSDKTGFPSYKIEKIADGLKISFK